MPTRLLTLTACTLVVFGVIVVLSYVNVLRSVHYERAIRSADLARAHAVRMQLDEETGMRGYTSTVNAAFLEPYHQAAAREHAVFANLAASVAPLREHTVLQADARSEQALHHRWRALVADPLIASPHRRDAVRLQVLGKRLMDEFRARDDHMQRTLQQVALRTDDTLTRTLGWLIGFGVIAEIGIFVFGLLSALAEERAERQRHLYENEKRIADTLQAAFFQPSLPDLPQLGLHGSYLPAEEHTAIGGDWYDAFVVREGQLFFSIGDVTGHGLDAAVTMSRARQSLIVNAMRESDPAKILEWTNDALVVQADRIVTAICGFVDLRSLEIRYATAGHPPPVLAHPDRAARFLPYGGLPLAIERHASFATFRESAAAGSLLILYTDGLTEYKRNLADAEAQLLSVADEIVRSPEVDDPTTFIRARFFQNASPADDVAVLGITFRQLIPDRPPKTLLSAMQVAAGRVQ